MTKTASSSRTPLPATKFIPLASLLIIISVSGCANTRSCLTAVCAPYEASKGCSTTERKARRAAREIWDCHHAQCYLNNCNFKDVREGFIEGFVSTCAGGDSCPPMFAPTKHSLCGLNKRCSTAWHEGWPLGAVAAESSGFTNSCCSRAHPCLRGPRIPCNPGCVRCDSGSNHLHYGDEMQYGNDGDYVIESFGAPEIVTESVHAETEAVEAHEVEVQASSDSGYEAPITPPTEQATPLVDPTPVAPEPPAVPSTEAATPAPAPPAPENVQAQRTLSLQISTVSEPSGQTKKRVSAAPVKPISGIQDTETRIASLIQRLERGESTQRSF